MNLAFKPTSCIYLILTGITGIYHKVSINVIFNSKNVNSKRMYLASTSRYIALL